MNVLDIAWQSWPDDNHTTQSHGWILNKIECTILFHIQIPTLFVQTIMDYIDLCAKLHGYLTLFTHNEATCKHALITDICMTWRVPEFSLQYCMHNHGLNGIQSAHPVAAMNAVCTNVLLMLHETKAQHLDALISRLWGLAHIIDIVLTIIILHHIQFRPNTWPMPKDSVS